MDVIHHGEEAYVTGEGALLIRPEVEEEKVPVRRSGLTAKVRSPPAAGGSGTVRFALHESDSTRPPPAVLLPR